MPLLDAMYPAYTLTLLKPATPNHQCHHFQETLNTVHVVQLNTGCNGQHKLIHLEDIPGLSHYIASTSFHYHYTSSQIKEANKTMLKLPFLVPVYNLYNLAVEAH